MQPEHRVIRQTKGATLAFAAAAIMLVVFIAVAFLVLLKIFGGIRELEHATTSGALNVSKEAVTIGVLPSDLSIDGQNNFQSLANGKTKLIDLTTYNRAVAQTMLVGMNANADAGGLNNLAAADAQKMLGALYGGGPNQVPPDKSLALSLSATLQDPGNSLSNHFLSCAAANGLRMLGNVQQQTKDDLKNYRVSYVNADSPENIHLAADSGLATSTSTNTACTLADPAINLNPTCIPGNALPQAGQTNNTDYFDPKTQQPYLVGYNSTPVVIPIGNGQSIKVRGVPNGPCKQPHLVSGTDFAKGHDVLLPNMPETINPPNAFQKGGTAMVDTMVVDQVSLKNRPARVISQGTIGVLDTNFPLSMPDGYVEIINAPGYLSTNYAPDTELNIYNQELMTGIYLGTDSAGNVKVFTIDQSALDTAIKYALSGGTTEVPSMQDSLGNPVFFDSTGNAITDAGSLLNLGLKSNGSGSTAPICTVANTTGGTAVCSSCASLTPAFTKAYMTWNPNVSYWSMPAEPGALIAVEAYNNNVTSAFTASWAHGNKNGIAAPVGDVSLASWYLGDPKNNTQLSGPGTSGSLPYGYSSGPTAYAGPQLTGFPQYATGLRMFDHSGRLAMGVTQYGLDGTYSFSKPGTAMDYIHEILSGSNITDDSFLMPVLQRVREIRPGTTMTELKSLLQAGSSLNLGAKMFVWMDAQGNLQLTPTPPPSFIPGTATDGNPRYFYGMPYNVLNTLVNVPSDNPMNWTQYHDILGANNPLNPATMGDFGIHAQLFQCYLSEPACANCGITPGVMGPPTPMPPNANLPKGQDFAEWIPCSGYNHLLGTLVFGSNVGNAQPGTSPKGLGGWRTAGTLNIDILPNTQTFMFGCTN